MTAFIVWILKGRVRGLAKFAGRFLKLYSFQLKIVISFNFVPFLLSSVNHLKLGMAKSWNKHFRSEWYKSSVCLEKCGRNCFKVINYPKFVQFFGEKKLALDFGGFFQIKFGSKSLYIPMAPFYFPVRCNVTVSFEFF